MVFVLVLQKQKQKAKNGKARAVKVVRKVVVVQTCYGLNLPEEKGASGI
jgi:hypothetical protein